MRFLLLGLLLSKAALGQTDRLEFIKEAVALIDADTTLVVETIDGSTIHQASYCNGSEVSYHFRAEQLVKIQSSFGMSWGRHTKAYYFHNDTLMLIRQTEETFILKDDGDWDRSDLVKRYEASYYQWTIEEEVGVERFGKPWFIEVPCGIFEMEPTLDLLRGWAK